MNVTIDNNKRKGESSLLNDVTKKKRYQYSNEELANALERVRQGENKHLIAAESKIPYSTIRKKFKTNCDGKCTLYQLQQLLIRFGLY